ncbi:hypothetical protein SBA5_290159 [Candidatus Sulfotelmatomonas gaucii]|uniref:Uncharacterized protein n=1 Tax=Candidatus Sulfuritelmatomonas gaucii TaxID=2043161 RepID=A0A2N9LBF5_9BACT|nr:hypothetical protein SBA5_290159 [Candidatus Sulfotelmatomonas gaucii]
MRPFGTAGVHGPDRAEGGAIREAVMGRRGAAVANTWFDWLQSARVDALISALRNSQKWLIQGRLNMPPIARSGTTTKPTTDLLTGRSGFGYFFLRRARLPSACLAAAFTGSTGRGWRRF